jgi:alanine dehydrogenase
MADFGSTTQFLKNNQGDRDGVYIYNGILTNETLGQKFGIISKDMDLLISVF